MNTLDIPWKLRRVEEARGFVSHRIHWDAQYVIKLIYGHCWSKFYAKFAHIIMPERVYKCE